jgi:menaquinone-dependent protoporphyrinogen oxidase
MRSLLLYASKKGYARECAQRIARGLAGDVETFAIKDRRKIGDLGRFDQVIAGGSIRAGHISGALRTFLADHESLLLEKRLGLFLCGTDPDNIEQQFATHYPKELIAHAMAKRWFGGRIVFAEQNLVLRFMLKKILKGGEDVHKEQPEAVEAFIADLASAG